MSRPGSRTRDYALLVLIVAVASSAGVVARRSAREPWPVAPVRGGRELVMVFIASSTCPGINEPGLKDAVARTREGLRRQAVEDGMTFVSIGVSLDRSIDGGVRLLQRFGPFDEISVGRSWINGAALKYLWQDLPGRASVPQILVLERQVDYGRWVEVREERARYRRIGAIPIIELSRLAFGID
jgi:hypothetical protein